MCDVRKGVWETFVRRSLHTLSNLSLSAHEQERGVNHSWLSLYLRILSSIL
jgi:hypothetical protein